MHEGTIAGTREADAREFDLILAVENDGHGAAAAREEVPAPSFGFADRPVPARPRTTVVGWLALAAAVVIPPVGLVLGLIARSLTRHRYGRSTWPTTLAIVLSVTLTVVLVIASFVAGTITSAAEARQAVVDESAAFCAEVGKTPGVLERSGFDWPTAPDSVGGSIAAMRTFETRWSDIAKQAPVPIRADAAAVAHAAGVIIAADQSSHTVDRQADLDAMSTVTAGSTLPAWAAEYCG